MPSGVYQRTQEHCKNISIALKKSSSAKIQQDRFRYNNPMMGKDQTAENNFNWKGDNARYSGKHMWIYYQKGGAKEYVHCGENTKRIEWANIDHKYSRKLSDYISLCKKCHIKHDKELNGKKDNSNN